MERSILYFAWVREQVGVGAETLVVPDDVVTLADLAGWLRTRGGGYAAAFADPSKVRGALDQTMVPLATPLGSAREIAFFPPVTGG